MKCIIVTGGLGFIGSHFIDICVKNKIFVVNIDNLSVGSNKKNITVNKKYYKFHKTNIKNKIKIRNIIKKYKPYAIINFAAETHVDRSITDPLPFIETNIIGLTNLANEFRIFINTNNQKEYKFIQISTDEVYGSTNKSSFKETDPLKPNSPYSSSKASAELILRSLNKTYKFRSIIIRPSNNFGPRQYEEKLIPLALMKLRHNQSIPIYGKGKNKREWFFVEDCARTIYNILNSKIKHGTYNIGTNNLLSNLNLIKYIIKEFKKLHQGKNNKSKFYKFVKDRPGHDFMYKLNLSKIKKTGLLFNSNFNHNIIKTIKYYQKK